jgi:hypothetical protein
MGPVSKGHGRPRRIGPMIASHALPFFCPPFQPKRGGAIRPVTSLGSPGR